MRNCPQKLTVSSATGVAVSFCEGISIHNEPLKISQNDDGHGERERERERERDGKKSGYVMPDRNPIKTKPIGGQIVCTEQRGKH